MFRKHAVLFLIVTLLSLLACTQYQPAKPEAETMPQPEAASLTAFKASTLYALQSSGKLVVGMEVKYWPFEYTDAQGNPTGYDVDIARLAAEELGVQLEIRDMEWTSLIPALQSGKVDMIISGMTATLTRAKAVTFTQPYFVTGLCALLSKQKAGNVKKIEDLDSPTVVLAVKTGTTGDLVASRRFPSARINRFKEETACVREVATGRADAFLYDQLSIAKHHKENPDTTRAILTPFTYEPFAMAIRKGDPDFQDWLNMFLATIKADGRLEVLKKKHFAEILGNRP